MYSTATLRRLSPVELQELARAHERQADRLREAAQRRQAEIEQHEQAVAAVDALRDLADLVEIRRRSGMSLDRTCQTVAIETATPLVCVYHHVRKREKEKEAARREARDREIVRLAGRGHSNSEIGRRVDFNPATVSRITRRRLGRCPAAPV